MLALFKSVRFLDRFEQVVVVALYIWLILRLWPEEIMTAQFVTLLLLVSEGAVLAFLLLRRQTDQISPRFRDWAIAAAGTFGVLLVSKGGAPIAVVPGAILMLSGMVVHITAKFSLRRSFGLVAANRGVKSTGMYNLVRHPMYTGYIISHIGYLLLAPSLWNLAVYLSVWSLLVARIYAEERLLSKDDAYGFLKERVRFRLVPGVF